MSSSSIAHKLRLFSLVATIGFTHFISSVANADIFLQRDPEVTGAKDLASTIAVGLRCSTEQKNDSFYRISVEKDQTTGLISKCQGDQCSKIREIELQRGDGNSLTVYCLNCPKAPRDLPIGLIEWAADSEDLQFDKIVEQTKTFSADYLAFNEQEQKFSKHFGLNCAFQNSSVTMDTRTTPLNENSRLAPLINDLEHHTPVAALSIPEDTLTEDEGTEQTGQTVLRTAGVSRESSQWIVCTKADGVIIRDARLTSPLFDAYKGDKIEILRSHGKKKRILRGEEHTFVSAKFIDKKRNGWISERYISRENECGKVDSSDREELANPRPTPAPKPKPVPQPKQEETEEPSAGNVGSLLAPNCAKSIILQSAKRTVRNRWGNRSYSGGQCALGVRQALQASGVGGIGGGIGHAIDFKRNLTRYGFVDTGLRDPSKAPPGAVIVLDGPNTASYLRTGRMSRPYGNYVGHVAIKGDDGFYYTDGRTAEVAIGWSGERNRSRIRNVVAIMVPNESLVRAHIGKCRGLK